MWYLGFVIIWEKSLPYVYGIRVLHAFVHGKHTLYSLNRMLDSKTKPLSISFHSIRQLISTTVRSNWLHYNEIEFGMFSLDEVKCLYSFRIDISIKSFHSGAWLCMSHFDLRKCKSSVDHFSIDSLNEYILIKFEIINFRIKLLKWFNHYFRIFFIFEQVMSILLSQIVHNISQHFGILSFIFDSQCLSIAF